MQLQFITCKCRLEDLFMFLNHKKLKFCTECKPVQPCSLHKSFICLTCETSLSCTVLFVEHYTVDVFLSRVSTVSKWPLNIKCPSWRVHTPHSKHLEIYQDTLHGVRSAEQKKAKESSVCSFRTERFLLLIVNFCDLCKLLSS